MISNRPEAQGLEWARSQGIATRVDRPQGASRRARRSTPRSPTRSTPLAPDLVAARGLHAHPHAEPSSRASRAASSTSIRRCCPSFPGLHTHRRALEAGVKLHGCTVHVVTPALDSGPIVVQAAVPVLAGRHRGGARRARARGRAPHLSAGGALVPRGSRRISRAAMSSGCAARAFLATASSRPAIPHETPRPPPRRSPSPALAAARPAPHHGRVRARSTTGVTIGRVHESFVRTRRQLRDPAACRAPRACSSSLRRADHAREHRQAWATRA